FTEEDYRRRDSHPHLLRVKDVFDDLLLGWSAVSGQSLYRTEAIRRIGGYDPSCEPCEDRDLLLRVARLGPALLCPGPVMTSRSHPGQFRPPNLRHFREAVARRAIRSLPSSRQADARRLRRTTALLDRAEDELTRGSVPTGLGWAGLAVVNTTGI